MQKIKGEDGKEYDVHTQEEIDALVTGKTAEKDQKLASLTKELDDLKKDPANKDWSGVRNQVEKLEGQIKTITTERDSDRIKYADEIRGVRTGLLSGAIESMTNGLAGGDAEVAKKIKFHYERIGGEVNSEQEAAAKLQDAFLLATGKQSPNPLNVARGSGGGQPPVPPAQQNVQVVELGKKFGISDDDVKKYGPKAAEKKPNNNQS